jgi:hypothetical protein
MQYINKTQVMVRFLIGTIANVLAMRLNLLYDLYKELYDVSMRKPHLNPPPEKGGLEKFPRPPR